jgi:hypothetical protein
VCQECRGSACGAYPGAYLGFRLAGQLESLELVTQALHSLHHPPSRFADLDGDLEL